MMTINKRALTLALLGILANNLFAKNDRFDFSITPITENVYSIVSPSFGLPTPENKGWNSNSHFVVTESGVLLFDTGSSETIGNKIKSAIASVTDKPVRWVINSHSHADHWFGNAAFAEAEIIASNHALTTMKAHAAGALKFYSQVTEGKIGTTELVYPTTLVTQAQKRTFGGVEAELIFANDGHSPGDLLLWLPEQEVILGGDVLGSDWMPIITGHGDVPSLIATLQTVAKLNPKHVLPGHGSATTVASVKRDVAFLSTLWRQVTTDHQNQRTAVETLADVKSQLGPKYSVQYKDFTSDIERYIKLMYQLQG